jgi:hypothetical protein
MVGPYFNNYKYDVICVQTSFLKSEMERPGTGLVHSKATRAQSGLQSWTTGAGHWQQLHLVISLLSYGVLQPAKNCTSSNTNMLFDLSISPV